MIYFFTVLNNIPQYTALYPKPQLFGVNNEKKIKKGQQFVRC